MASNRNGIKNIVKKYNLCNNESKEVTLERSEREKDIGVMMDQNVKIPFVYNSFQSTYNKVVLIS